MDYRSESSSLALSWLLEQEVIIFCPVAKIKRWYLIFLQTTDIFTFLCLYKTCRITLALHVHDLTFTSGGGEGVVLELQSLHFNIYKCDTTGYFQGHLGSISGCIFNRKLGHVHRVCGQKKCVFHKTSVHLQTFIVATNLFFSFPNWFLCFTRNWKLNLNKCKVATWIVVGRNIHHQSVSCRLSCLRNTLVATQRSHN